MEHTIFLICFDASNSPRPLPTIPALFETTVRPVIELFFLTASMSVSGTPQRPKPPQRRVLLDLRDSIASSGEETTLLIWVRRAEKANAREM